MMELVVTTGALSRANSSHIVATNKPTPNCLQAGCPSCHSTNSVKALVFHIEQLYVLFVAVYVCVYMI